MEYAIEWSVDHFNFKIILPFYILITWSISKNVLKKNLCVTLNNL